MCSPASPKVPVQDLHFRVEGPVVTRLQEAFVNDWAFTTGEVLDGELWFPRIKRIRQRHRARHHRRTGCGFRQAALDAARRAGRGANLRANRHALFSAGQRACHLAEPRRAARRARGHHLAREKQPARSCIGRRARCGGRCSNAAATSGSRRRRSTIPS